jgi:hypothetical protein
MQKFRGLSLIALSLCLSGCVLFSRYDIGQTYIASSPRFIPQAPPPTQEIKKICLEHQNLRGFLPHEKEALIKSIEEVFAFQLSKGDTCDMKVSILEGKRKTSLAFGIWTYHNYMTVSLSVNFTKDGFTFSKQYFAANREEADRGKGIDYVDLGRVLGHDALSFATNRVF